MNFMIFGLEGKQKISIYAKNLALFDTFGEFSRPIWNEKLGKVAKSTYIFTQTHDFKQNK